MLRSKQAKLKRKQIRGLLFVCCSLCMLAVSGLVVAQPFATTGSKASQPRPAGPCDIYAAAHDPCVAAYSTTRALYATYDGPLYEIRRQSDGKTLEIDVKGGGYADAAAQRSFCAATTCMIIELYDQSPMHNNVTRELRGHWYGPGMGGIDNLAVANMAPVMVMGHEVYGLFISPGTGLRNNDTKGLAVGDQAESEYWVVSGRHYDNGCCFDFGNAEIDSSDDGDGAMETLYFGDGGRKYVGIPPGPWVMTDQENNLLGCVRLSESGFCPHMPIITWPFVTGMVSGWAHHWRIMDGDAKQGALSVVFDGPRLGSSYDPMHKQGAIVLGTGGDNSSHSQGTFFEGAVTAAGSFATEAVQQRVQANVVAAECRTLPLAIGSTAGVPAHSGLQTFSLESTGITTLTFTNTLDVPVDDVKFSLSLPSEHSGITVSRVGNDSKNFFLRTLAPGEGVSATFRVTTGSRPFNGKIIGRAQWKDVGTGKEHSVTRAERLRNVPLVRIHQFRIGTLSPSNATNSFIELYNASRKSVDISDWTLTVHPIYQSIFSRINIPAGTVLAGNGSYLIGLSDSGLAVAASAGDKTIYVRNTVGMKAGDVIEIGTGSRMETRKVAVVGTAASDNTTLWQPLRGHMVAVPAGSTNVPVESTSGFFVGQKVALGYSAVRPALPETPWEDYEVATVTEIGTPATHHFLSRAVKSGSTGIEVKSVKGISVGDEIRLGTNSVGHGVETITIKHIDHQHERLELATPLRFNHMAGLPFSDRGTGISFEPKTNFVHRSDEPIQALGTGITLQRALSNDYPINAVVRDARVEDAGYHGRQVANQRFGGPVLYGVGFQRHFVYAGSMVLRTAKGAVVDSLNYGRIVDPSAAAGSGDEAERGRVGCVVTAPKLGAGAGLSAIRIGDTGSNCLDFKVMPTTLSGGGSDLTKEPNARGK